jgi:outer membrane protein assembly factor BamB
MRRLRRLLPLTAALAVVLTGSQIHAAAPIPSEWRQSDGNAAHSRANLQERTLSTANVGTLGFDMALALAPDPDPENNLDRCARTRQPVPAVSSTRLFTVYGDDFAALDTRTGARVWRQPLLRVVGLREAANVIVAYGSRVFVGVSDCTSESDPTMRVVAFDAATGRKLWQRTGLDGWSHLVAAEGRLVVSGATAAGSQAVHVLDAATGATTWDQYHGCYIRQAVVVRRLVIMSHCEDQEAGTFEPRLEARRVSDGALRWTRPGTWTPERGDLETTEGRLILGTDANGALTALDAGTGTPLWTAPQSSGSLAVDQYRVYARCGQDLCALSRTTGAQLWTRPAATGDIVVANGVVYLPDGELLRASSGASLGRIWADGHRLVAVANGRVVALDEALRAYDLYAPGR